MLSIAFTVIGLAAIVVFAIQAYKTAVSTERNAALWTVVTVLTGFLFQNIIPFAVGFALGAYYVLTGGDLSMLDRDLGGYLTMIDILAVVLSIWGMGMVVKFISGVKDEKPGAHIPPPPPPTFTGD